MNIVTDFHGNIIIIIVTIGVNKNCILHSIIVLIIWQMTVSISKETADNNIIIVIGTIIVI